MDQDAKYTVNDRGINWKIMISYSKGFIRSMRSFFSRSEWTIRLLGLSRLEKAVEKPGLVMVQIDGLSLTQFDRSLHEGHMPFLNSLLKKERYALHPFYSGVPSNTPAVQGELFYGVKTCVPAFSFVDHKTGQSIKMNDTTYVTSFETELKKQGIGLLTGGSSYSNMFAGGAEEAHFCWGKMGWSGILHAINPFLFPFLFVLYIDIFIKTFCLLVFELIISAYECIQGTIKGRVFLREFEIVWLRVLICVFLREFIVAGVCMDIKRGLPVIHLNFLGYDEQAHGRGPRSAFAHWSLQGIDYAIRRIDRVIKQSTDREYDLWVYSDHGQEKTVPYLIKYGCSFEEAVRKVFVDPLAVITAMGPMGHIYPQKKLDAAEIKMFAQRLVDEVHIPLVITRLEDNKVLAWTKRGQFILPQEDIQVFGDDHLFLAELTEDVIRACYHPDAGDFIVLGWCKDEIAISFPLEYGAHAGTGKEETKAFVLLPIDIYVEPNGKNYMRPINLRTAAENFLSEKPFFSYSNFAADPTILRTLRVMSYNVHGCKGMDGRILTDRIARVIARDNPDVVCLQEVDVERLRSFGVDQAQMIAQKLDMDYHFHPAYRYKDEQYGNVILSRYPMELIKKDALPKLWNKRFMEPRGALWVAIDYHGTKIDLVNTHLSLWPKERLLQIKALLNKEWLGSPDCNGPVILCGDLNMTPKSPVYNEICRRLKDSQLLVAGQKPIKTWFAGYPLRRIDHIFVTSEFCVNSIQVSHTALDRAASDHSPIIADLSLNQQEALTVRSLKS